MKTADAPATVPVDPSQYLELGCIVLNPIKSDGILAVYLRLGWLELWLSKGVVIAYRWTGPDMGGADGVGGDMASDLVVSTYDKGAGMMRRHMEAMRVLAEGGKLTERVEFNRRLTSIIRRCGLIGTVDMNIEIGKGLT